MWRVHSKCQMTIDGLSREVAASASENVELRTAIDDLSRELVQLRQSVGDAIALGEKTKAAAEKLSSELNLANATLRTVASHLDGDNRQILEVLAAYSPDLVADSKLPTMSFSVVSPLISSQFPRMQHQFSSPEFRKLFPIAALSIGGKIPGSQINGSVRYRGTFQEACAIIQTLTVGLVSRGRANVLTMDPKTQTFTFIVA